MDERGDVAREREREAASRRNCIVTISDVIPYASSWFPSRYIRRTLYGYRTL